MRLKYVIYILTIIIACAEQVFASHYVPQDDLSVQLMKHISTMDITQMMNLKKSLFGLKSYQKMQNEIKSVNKQLTQAGFNKLTIPQDGVHYYWLALEMKTLLQNQPSLLMQLDRSLPSSAQSIYNLLWSEIYPFQSLSENMGLYSINYDIYAKAWVREVKALLPIGISLQDTLKRRSSSDWQERYKNDFKLYLRELIQSTWQSASLTTHDMFPTLPDGTTTEPSLIAYAQAKLIQNQFIRNSRNPSSEFQQREKNYNDLNIDINAALENSEKIKLEKIVQAFQQIHLSAAALPPNLQALDTELKTSRTHMLDSSATDRASYELLEKTGLVNNFFNSWLWLSSEESLSDGQPIADITGQTSRSLARVLYGDDLIRTLHWPAIYQGPQKTADIDQVRVAVNQNLYGALLSMEMLVQDQRGEWQAYFFERRGSFWLIQKEMDGKPTSNKCLICHASRGGSISLGKMSPLPRQLRTEADFLAVGYKDRELIRRFLQF